MKCNSSGRYTREMIELIYHHKAEEKEVNRTDKEAFGSSLHVYGKTKSRCVGE